MPQLNPGMLAMLRDAYDAQKAGWTARTHTPLPADREAQPLNLAVDLGAVGGIRLTGVEEMHYSTEALLPGGQGIDDLGWSTLRMLKAGMPPWGDSDFDPQPYIASVRVAQEAGYSDADMDRLALWYVECGSQFVVPDRARASLPMADGTGLQGLIEAMSGAPWYQGLVSQMIATNLIDGECFAPRALPPEMLDAPCMRRDGVVVRNGTYATLAPTAWRPDGSKLTVLADPTVAPYCVTLGVQTSADLFSPQSGPKLCQMIFEYVIATASAQCLVDFCIGPERYPLGDCVLGGGTNPAISTWQDLVDFYVPSSLITYFQKVRSFQSLPSFASLGYDTISLGGPQLSMRGPAAHQLTDAYMQLLGNRRCLPQGERVPAFLDTNYWSLLWHMLHDGPGFAGLRGWPKANPGNHFTPSGLPAFMSMLGSAVSFIGSLVATVATDGAAAPLIPLVSTIAHAALTTEQLGATLAASVGYHSGAWHGFAGISSLLNATQQWEGEITPDMVSLLNAF